MPFHNREEAAHQLVEKLQRFKSNTDTIVLALPRGGVVLGRIVADALALPLDIVVPRKIGAPENEEYAIGAITETGDVVWNEAEHARAPKEYLARTIAAEQKEAARRLKTYRPPGQPRNLLRKTAIIVDDGIATGLTMRAAIATVKREGASRLIVAVPVCPSDTKKELEREIDELVVLETPVLFGSIGAFYEEFPQVEDPIVIKLLQAKTV